MRSRHGHFQECKADVVCQQSAEHTGTGRGPEFTGTGRCYYHQKLAEQLLEREPESRRGRRPS